MRRSAVTILMFLLSSAALAEQPKERVPLWPEPLKLTIPHPDAKVIDALI